MATGFSRQHLLVFTEKKLFAVLSGKSGCFFLNVIATLPRCVWGSLMTYPRSVTQLTVTVVSATGELGVTTSRAGSLANFFSNALFCQIS